MGKQKRFVRANGPLVQHLRSEKGWTQKKLTEVSGFKLRTIQKVEASKSVALETLECIAQSLSRGLGEPIRYEQLVSKVGICEAFLHAVTGIDTNEFLQQLKTQTQSCTLKVFGVVNSNNEPLLFEEARQQESFFHELSASTKSNAMFSPNILFDLNQEVAMTAFELNWIGEIKNERHSRSSAEFVFSNRELEQVNLWFGCLPTETNVGFIT